MRRIVRNLLKAPGDFNTDEAEDSVAALLKLKTGNFQSVLLLDMEAAQHANAGDHGGTVRLNRALSREYSMTCEIDPAHPSSRRDSPDCMVTRTGRRSRSDCSDPARPRRVRPTVQPATFSPRVSIAVKYPG